MGGGLLNLVSESNQNIIINGNPNKTFFKKKFTKHTNFGIQKYRLNPETNVNHLDIINESNFFFKITDYGDLMLENYFVLTLPDIWSPIVEIENPPSTNYYNYITENNTYSTNFLPYEFKWIENLGSQLIKKVKYTINGKTIQEFTGQYIYCKAEKELNNEKKKLFDEMTGNTKDLNDPANYGGRNNIYPNSKYLNKINNFVSEPSIRGRKIYIPLNHFSLLSDNKFFPLLLIKDNKLNVQITCRPLYELFVVRYIYNINEIDNYNTFFNYFFRDNYDEDRIELFQQIFEFKKINKIGKYVYPDQNKEEYLMYRFLINFDYNYLGENNYTQTLNNNLYDNGTITGNIEDRIIYNINSSTDEKVINKLKIMDCHLLVEYVFLSEDEKINFINNNKYVFKYIIEKIDKDYQDTNAIKLTTSGLLYSWMWFFQRSDVNLRNQWSNYTNWETDELPFKGISSISEKLNNKIFSFIPNNIYDLVCKKISNSGSPATYNNITFNNFELTTIDYRNSNYWNQPYIISGPKKDYNIKRILKSFSIICDGKYRENNLESGIFNYIEKYYNNNIAFKDGLYNYNFNINNYSLDNKLNNTFDINYFNISFFNKILIEFQLLKANRIKPYSDEYDNPDNYDFNNEIIFFRDPDTNRIIATNTQTVNIYEFRYDLHLMEEHLFLLEFSNNNISSNFFN